MGRFQLILLVVALASPVFSRPNFFESSEEDFALGLSDSFEDEFSSEEMPLQESMMYSPSKDGPPENWLAKIKAGMPPGTMLQDEDKMLEQMKQLYQDFLGQPLPQVTAADRKNMNKELNDAEIAKTNELRAQHGSDPVVFDEQLAALAKNYADKIANQMSQGVPFEHNPENKIYSTGENMAERTGAPESYDGWSTALWYTEKQVYQKNGNRPVPQGVEPATGHFTQVVWKGTQKMGCGQGTVKGGKIVTICNYYPAGNMQGMSSSETQQNYDENVVA